MSPANRVAGVFVLIDVEREQVYWRERMQAPGSIGAAGDPWNEIWVLMLCGYALFADPRRFSMDEAIKAFESHPDYKGSHLREYDRRMCFAQVWSRCLQMSIGLKRKNERAQPLVVEGA